LPIKKVRLNISMKGVQLTDLSQHVIPGNNDRILIYKDNEGKLQYHPVTFWNAVKKTLQAKREKRKVDLNQLPPKHSNGQLIEVFQDGDMFLLGIKKKEGETNAEAVNKLSTEQKSDKLYKVQKIGGNDDYWEICFRHHLDARPDKEAKKGYKYIKNFKNGKTGWYGHDPIKVTVSRIGKIKSL